MKRISFCDNWTFKRVTDQTARPVSLPHDAMQEEERRPDAPGGSGCAFFSGGSYIYEKTFNAPQAWAEETVMVEFEGVYPSARAYLNGCEIGGCNYGYNLFRVTLKGLNYGSQNTLRVEADNSRLPNSRWYTGAGIYRPVWLLTMNREHILPDGIRVTTEAYDPAEIRVEVKTGSDIKNTEKTECEVRIEANEEANQTTSEELDQAASEIKPDAERDRSIHIEIFEYEVVPASPGTIGAKYAGRRAHGKKVAEAFGSDANLFIPGAKLWDAEQPNLYECVATLLLDGIAVDTQSTVFGIRKLAWSPEGFFVNGKSVLLKGGCIHHDNGILGARSFRKSEYRRIRKLKEMGYNAIRSSHNPACRAVLEACDELGMYVMDELWDMWDKSKTEFDYAAQFPDNYENDIENIVSKDYNHPSVILYSIGNEVTEPAKPEGVALAEKLVDRVHAADATRPVTAGINITLLFLATLENNPLAGAGEDSGREKSAEAGENEDGEGNVEGETNAAPAGKEMNSTAYNEMVSMMGKRMTMAAATPPADAASTPVLDLLDIAGYNYAVSRYENESELHPNRIVVGSETYTYELAKTWPMVERIPYLIGDFMWTAWDYLGETGIGGWSYDPEDRGFDKKYPWLLADSGAIDILGNDNAEAGLASVVWGARETPYIGVSPVNHPGVTPNRAIWRGSNALPYWSYQGCNGNAAEVEICTQAEKAELFVNGVSAGIKPVKDRKAVFQVNYEPGELRAVALDEDGHAIAESSLRSADEHTRIRVTPEETCVASGDIIYVNIDLCGENGEIECNRDTLLCVSVEGGELLAFGSANPKTEEDFLSGQYTTYYGRAQAVVKVTSEQTTVVVSGEGFPDASAEIYAE